MSSVRLWLQRSPAPAWFVVMKMRSTFRPFLSWYVKRLAPVVPRRTFLTFTRESKRPPLEVHPPPRHRRLYLAETMKYGARRLKVMRSRTPTATVTLCRLPHLA